MVTYRLNIAVLNLTAGLLTTVAQFLRVSELLEGHRAAAISYSKFSRNISVELSLPREDRSKGGTEFVNMCRVELDRLIEQSPNIPIGIIKQFGKKFANSTFMKPEILNITSVQVYRDIEKERTIEKLEEFIKSTAISVVEDIEERYDKMGYHLYKDKLKAHHFGAATTRERLILIAIRKDLGINDFKFPEPTHGKGLLPIRTVNKALKTLDLKNKN